MVIIPALLYRVQLLPLEACQVVASKKRLSDFCMVVAGIPLFVFQKTLHTSKGHGLALQLFPERYVSRVLNVLTGSAPMMNLPSQGDQPLSLFVIFKDTVKLACKWLSEDPAPPPPLTQPTLLPNWIVKGRP